MSLQRLGDMSLKAILVVALLLALATAAFVADAASSTQAALAQAHAASFTQSAQRRLDIYARASTMLEDGWSRPLAWHAGAQEAMSWIKAQEKDLPASADFAARAVRSSPMQGLSWMRLAGLELRGVRQGACAPQACLTNSVRVLPMLPAREACSRIELLHLSGASFEPGDARVVAYLATQPTRSEIEACLGFMPAEDLYEALLMART